MLVQSRAHARSPSAYVTHLSMPISVHSESSVHVVQSWFDVGTHTDATWPSTVTPTTSRQPSPIGHSGGHTDVHCPVVPTAMQMLLWHSFLSVHGWPKPLSIGISGASPSGGPASGGIWAGLPEAQAVRTKAQR